MRRLVLRVVIVFTLLLGVNYVAWRWLFSLNWDAWWIAVPLVAAETFSLIDVSLFALAAWRSLDHASSPPDPAVGLTVDVFITTYNEEPELVLATVRAALAIEYPHQTWVLDDGARPHLKEAAEQLGAGYISRGAEWDGKPRHAKAGNLNNALQQTQGEFFLVLDADQVPNPNILDRMLGYFSDRRVAFVQSPQWFGNVQSDDPLGSQAPLFYGPIMRGKDGWNAAFFCGSNAVMRREALMQLGLSGYVADTERRVRTAFAAGQRVIRRARRRPEAKDKRVAALLAHVEEAFAAGNRDLAAGGSIAEATYRVQSQTDAAVRNLVAGDLAALNADLAQLRLELGDPHELAEDAGVYAAAVDRLAARDLSPLGALESVMAVLEAANIDRAHEAQPVMPLSTISVTEDMSTSMRLHAAGWRSVYHHEVLAVGLAPEDLPSMLSQRLRWAQGTIQVMLRENPLTMRGLSLAQRLMYLGTMWSYLSGFAAVIYFAGPLVYLLTGILPVHALSLEFFARFVPFMILNQALFLVAANGAPTWRGQQYSLALFPTWIRACTTAAANVWFGRPLGFAVTPKTRQSGVKPLRLLRFQAIVAVLLALACLLGLVRWLLGLGEGLGTLVNVTWAVYDLLALAVLIGAAKYQGFERTEAPAPNARRRQRPVTVEK
ncbi:glycosyltransferase [Sinomonas sp. JGH33]|uniref:Glycosyltransferase n=1 Tax=Sinomonas terricola TaxID=3110330 RepID=A0ABU5T595_9MICC|nr:glycosyltransferase [Sinomonas sp. JGH33]MEA5454745.1 glycosyltransferase [Sinomonas sp. JGH33]